MTFKLATDLAVDLATLVDTRLLIQANSGGGKSYCVRRLLEQTHGKVQHLVIDLEGEFVTLREQFEYVHAAKGGDTPADPRTAPLLAERLLELKASAILDIYELRHHDRILFVKRFLDALVNAPKALWHPVLVIVDEAHVFCPQQGEAESASAVIDLCTRGRKRGFAAVLATQRLSKLHKDAAAECNNKLIGRSSLDVDMKRAADELGFSSRDQQLALRKLDPGVFFAYGPALSREVRQVTIGEVTTTHPKAGGSRIAFTPPPPSGRVKAVLAKLADLPAEIEHRTKTEAELRAEIAALRRQVAEKPIQKAAGPPKVVKVPVLKDSQITRLEATFRRLEAFAQVQMTAIQETIRKNTPAVPAAERMDRRDANFVQSLRTEILGLRPKSPWVPGSNGDTDPTLPVGERKVLVAVAQHQEGVNRRQISVLSGFKKSTRDVYVQRLTARGLLELQNGQVHATAAGQAALGRDFEPLPTGAALQGYWLEKLPTGEAKLFGQLIRRYPEAVSREELSDASGFKKSTRDVYIQRLVARSLITTDRGGVRVSDTLFG